MKQLESIRAQTRLPDEVIIGDDCSTDNTARLVEEFATSAPFPVRSYINEVNRGTNLNFERALHLCCGDIIVVCDDDDVCLPDRLQIAEQRFLSSPRLGLVVDNSILADRELTPLGMTLWDRVGLTARRARTAAKDPLAVLAKHFAAWGHVIAFRTDLRPSIVPFPQESLSYHFFDVWVAFVLASITDVAYNQRPLVLHRVHRGQIAGVGLDVNWRKRMLERRSRDTAKSAEFACLLDEVIRRVSLLPQTASIARSVEYLKCWAEHIRMWLRLSTAKRRRVIPIANALVSGRYHRYSSGFLSAARDLLILQ